MLLCHARPAEDLNPICFDRDQFAKFVFASLLQRPLSIDFLSVMFSCWSKTSFGQVYTLMTWPNDKNLLKKKKN